LMMGSTTWRAFSQRSACRVLWRPTTLTQRSRGGRPQRGATNIAENTLAAASALRVERRAGDGRRVRRRERPSDDVSTRQPAAVSTMLGRRDALGRLSRRLVTASGKLAPFPQQ
jgi:hypothetical protein